MRFRPKEAYHQAKQLEKAGKSKEAATLYANIAYSLRRRGKFSEALAFLERAISLYPSATRLHVQIALVFRGLKKSKLARMAMERFSEEAMEKGRMEAYRSYVDDQLAGAPELREIFYSKHLSVDRTSVAAFLKKAQALMDQKDFQGAKRSALEALQTDKNSQEALQCLEQVVRQAGWTELLPPINRFKQSKISLEDLLTLLSDGSVATPIVAEEVPEKNLETLIRELEREVGMPEESQEDSVKPLIREFRRRSKPVLEGDAKARCDMALAFLEMGLFEEAKEELASISRSEESYWEAQVLLGQVYLAQESWMAALDVFQACLRENGVPKSVMAESLYQTVQIYARLGDKDQAKRHLDKLEKSYPGFRDLKPLRLQFGSSKKQ